MMKMKAFMFAAAASIGLAASVTPAAAQWIMIGQRNVTDRAETDTIVLGGHRQYERIRICAYRNPVHFRDLDIHFQNGGHQDADVRARINPGECTRAIDLTGDDRDITSIVMRYEETSARRARATVRVFAE